MVLNHCRLLLLALSFSFAFSSFAQDEEVVKAPAETVQTRKASTKTTAKKKIKKKKPAEPAIVEEGADTPAVTKTMTAPTTGPGKAAAHALKEAQKTAKRGEYDKAISELEGSFNFAARETPVAVTATVCLWGTRVFNYGKAAQAAEAGIKAHMTWWPEYLKTKKDETVDVSEYLSKLRKNHLMLLGCYGEAKSQVYVEKFDKMSAPERAQMRHEIKKTYDFLIQSDFPADKAEAFNTRVTEADDIAKKKRRKFFIDGTAQMFFWQDRFDFSGLSSGTGTALINVACPGIQLGYRSFFTEYGVGGCLGYGHARMNFDDNALESSNQAFLIDLNASAIRKMAENRIGLGAELNTFLMRIDSASEAGYKAKDTTEFRAALLIVTRINYEKFSFDIKGGRALDVPSMLWTAGFTFNLK